jgi:hypothetical protein
MILNMMSYHFTIKTLIEWFSWTTKEIKIEIKTKPIIGGFGKIKF